MLEISCGPLRPDETDVVVLYSTDVFNYIFPYNLPDYDSPRVGLANFDSLVQKRRAEYGKRCVVLDNGNRFDGGVTAFYYDSVDTLSLPLCVRMEEFIGYDAVGLGPRDLSQNRLWHFLHSRSRSDAPVVCANLVDKHTGNLLFRPYTMLECDGVRIAVMGMTSPEMTVWLSPEVVSQVEVLDMIECAQRWMPEIQSQSPDLVIGLFACGIEYDNESYDIDSYKNPAGGIPAAIRTTGFDFVFLGNDEHVGVMQVKDDAGQDVVCLSAGQDCQYAGEVLVHLKKDAIGKYQKTIEATTPDLSQYQAREEFYSSFQGVADTLKSWLDQPLGFLRDTIFGADGFKGPDKFRQFVNKAQLWRAPEAQISMTSCLLGDDYVPAGPVKMRDLFRLYRYENYIETVEMTGDEVIRYLEHSATMQFGPDAERNDPMGFTSAHGIRYQVDLNKPVGSRVSVLSMSDGSPFSSRERYVVAVNSYQASDGGGHYISQGLGWNAETYALHSLRRRISSTRLALLDYLEHQGVDTIVLRDEPAWSIVPRRNVFYAEN